MNSIRWFDKTFFPLWIINKSQRMVKNSKNNEVLSFHCRVDIFWQDEWIFRQSVKNCMLWKIDKMLYFLILLVGHILQLSILPRCKHSTKSHTRVSSRQFYNGAALCLLIDLKISISPILIQKIKPFSHSIKNIVLILAFCIEKFACV